MKQKDVKVQKNCKNSKTNQSEVVGGNILKPTSSTFVQEKEQDRKESFTQEPTSGSEFSIPPDAILDDKDDDYNQEGAENVTLKNASHHSDQQKLSNDHNNEKENKKVTKTEGIFGGRNFCLKVKDSKLKDTLKRRIQENGGEVTLQERSSIIILPSVYVPCSESSAAALWTNYKIVRLIVCLRNA